MGAAAAPGPSKLLWRFPRMRHWLFQPANRQNPDARSTMTTIASALSPEILDRRTQTKAWFEALHGAAQFGSQPVGGKHSKQSAFGRCRIRRLGFGHGCEVCSSLQLAQDVLGFFLCLYHDDAHGNFRHLGMHSNTDHREESKG